MLKIQTYEAARLILHDPRAVPSPDAKRLLRAFERIQSRKFQWLVDEMKAPEREAFDRVWLSIHGFQSEREQTVALRAIHEAVRRISNEMDTQEQEWVGDRTAARAGGNPQDLMKGKRVSILSPKSCRERIEAAEKTRGIWVELPDEEEDEIRED